MADREDLINQLAASMGAGGFAASRYESRYVNRREHYIVTE